MDEQRFDRLTTMLATVPAHRDIASQRGRRVFVGGMVGALLATLQTGGVSEGKKKGGKGGKGKGKGCKGGTKKCGKKCIPASNCCTSADCSLCKDEVCTNGTCGCEPGAFEYFGVCGIPPLCLVVAEICESNSECCSGHCDVRADDGTLRCNRGAAKCVTDLECVPGFLCRGFACTANPPCN